MGDVELFRGELLVVAARTELAESIASLGDRPGQELLWQYLEAVTCSLCAPPALSPAITDSVFTCTDSTVTARSLFNGRHKLFRDVDRRDDRLTFRF